jgi:hypothetical protein
MIERASESFIKSRFFKVVLLKIETDQGGELSASQKRLLLHSAGDCYQGEILMISLRSSANADKLKTELQCIICV